MPAFARFAASFPYAILSSKPTGTCPEVGFGIG